MSLIQEVSQINLEWLSSVLPFDDILSFKAEKVALNNADAIRINLQYAENASQKPEKLFLKIVRRYGEFSFYTYIAPRTPNLPLVKSYYAAFKNEEGWGNVLFTDIGETYETLPKGLPPSISNLKQFMILLAQLHRQWWQNESLVSGDLAQHLDDVPSFVFQQLSPKFSAFVDKVGDALAPKRRKAYEKILGAWPLAIWENRLAKNQGVSLVHGDTHFANFAIPKQVQDPIYLQDWALWHRNIPAYDLSYLFSRCLPEYRTRLEQDVIQHYHANLDISDYSWADCWQDYRLTMIFQTLWPIFFHQWISAEFWYTLIESSMTAFEQLGSEDFL